MLPRLMASSSSSSVRRRITTYTHNPPTDTKQSSLARQCLSVTLAACLALTCGRSRSSSRHARLPSALSTTTHSSLYSL